ncbi:MAG TPA: phosphatase PAP2 family protein [Chloroflexota bacterium]|nr:phosphatase PAP2 family protein [Chloroflexota bacterium]
MACYLRRIGRRFVQPLLYLLLLLAGFECYRAISMQMPRQSLVAHHHAATVIDLERRWGVFWEPRLQHLALHNDPSAAASAINQLTRYLVARIYKSGQVPWLLAMLCWLYLFRRGFFKRMCVAIILCTLAAILCAAIWPVAPPRFALAGPPYWVEDVTGMPVSERILSRMVGFDPYASLPSIHVLWAALTTLGLWYGASNWRMRVAATAFTGAEIVTVLITGNHYLLDCLASLALLATYLLLQAGLLRLWAWRNAERVRDVCEAPGARVRTQGASLRPMDSPLLLCACAACILLLAGDDVERSAGVLLLCMGAAALLLARRRVRSGGVLCASTPHAEWVSGALFVAGTTAIDAHQMAAHLAAGSLWLSAVTLIFSVRLGTAQDIHEERSYIPAPATSWAAVPESVLAEYGTAVATAGAHA